MALRAIYPRGEPRCVNKYHGRHKEFLSVCISDSQMLILYLYLYFYLTQASVKGGSQRHLAAKRKASPAHQVIEKIIYSKNLTRKIDVSPPNLS